MAKPKQQAAAKQPKKQAAAAKPKPSTITNFFSKASAADQTAQSYTPPPTKPKARPFADIRDLFAAASNNESENKENHLPQKRQKHTNSPLRRPEVLSLLGSDGDSDGDAASPRTRRTLGPLNSNVEVIDLISSSEESEPSSEESEESDVSSDHSGEEEEEDQDADDDDDDDDEGDGAAAAGVGGQVGEEQGSRAAEQDDNEYGMPADDAAFEDSTPLSKSDNGELDEFNANLDRVMDEMGVNDAQAGIILQGNTKPVAALSRLEVIAFFSDRRVIAWLKQKPWVHGVRTPKSSKVLDDNLREFGGEAKRQVFQTMLKEVLELDPALKDYAKYFVHPGGSFKDNVIAAMHYATFTTKKPEFGCVTDTTNCCIAWLKKLFGRLDDIYLFDAYPVRMRRDNPTHKVWLSFLSDAVRQRLDEHFVENWARSMATVGFVFGAENADRYKRLFPKSVPLTLSRTKMYGEEVHAYLELDERGQFRRLTFLMYHPEAILRGIQYRRGPLVEMLASVSLSIAFPSTDFSRLPVDAPEPRRAAKASGIELFRQMTTGINTLMWRYHAVRRDQRLEDGRTTWLVERIAWLLRTEALLGIHLRVADIPADILPFINHPLPEPRTGNHEGQIWSLCGLLSRTLHLVRQQGPLPPSLAKISAADLKILDSDQWQPVKSLMWPAVYPILDQVDKNPQSVRRKNLAMNIKQQWTYRINGSRTGGELFQKARGELRVRVMPFFAEYFCSVAQNDPGVVDRWAKELWAISSNNPMVNKLWGKDRCQAYFGGHSAYIAKEALEQLQALATKRGGFFDSLKNLVSKGLDKAGVVVFQRKQETFFMLRDQGADAVAIELVGRLFRVQYPSVPQKYQILLQQ
ncbi:hypothetical protein LTR56_014472 [Elasticomyces elasticus]|nr:hypothetical protein LTR56_014472 [Elasticomyces elasticus]KAK3646530.1 hypothetical protein LTR22_014293 [Elasticomyces elasticus]KAK4910443.1 hypothetical protein LTR49_020878 [Elasticomyces elasticus]KAK5755659.1 hypothetical protein LTS12_014220 [Elasticomyces elasticus]